MMQNDVIQKTMMSSADIFICNVTKSKTDRKLLSFQNRNMDSAGINLL